MNKTKDAPTKISSFVPWVFLQFGLASLPRAGVLALRFLAGGHAVFAPAPPIYAAALDTRAPPPLAAPVRCVPAPRVL